MDRHHFRKQILFFFVVASVWVPGSKAAAQNHTVKLEIAYSTSLPVGVAQQWLSALKKTPVAGIRLTVNPKLTPSIKRERLKTGDLILIVGRINKRQKLVVPGREFSISDVAGFRTWLEQVRLAKPANNSDSNAAFGLTDAQLVEVHQLLGKPYPELTRGQQVAKILQVIRSQIRIKIVADEKTLLTLSEHNPVGEELKGLSCGTLMAAIIRPLGLVFRVDDSGQQLQIVDSRDVKEHWPVGWPPQDRSGKIAPSLFKNTEVDIEDFPLKEVLDVIEKKTKVPFIYDQNTLARVGVDLAEIEITIAKTNTFYEKIIRTALLQSKPALAAELRVDESGMPFLWITRSGTKP